MSESDITRYAGGRPTRCTDNMIVQLASLIADGMTYALAAEACGIHSDTFRQWMRKGEAGEEPYVALVVALQRAEALGAHALLQKVQAASDMDWKAAAWLLERRHPESYARQRPQDQQPHQPQQHLHVHILAEAQRAGIISDAQIAAIDAQIIQSRSDAPKQITAPEDDA